MCHDLVSVDGLALATAGLGTPIEAGAKDGGPSAAGPCCPASLLTLVAEFHHGIDLAGLLLASNVSWGKACRIRVSIL